MRAGSPPARTRRARRISSAVTAALFALAFSAVSPLAADATTPTTTPTAPASPSPQQKGACPDFEFIGARGSGEDSQFSNSTRYTAKNPTWGMGGEVNDVFQRLNQAAEANDVTITPYGVPYPAVGIDVVGSETLATGDLSIYTKSVELGAHAAAAQMERIAGSCPQTGIILSGYSQGAQALVDAELSATPNARAKVVAAVFFGNTYFDASDSADDYGSYEPDLDGYLVNSGLLPANAIGPNGPVGSDWSKTFGTAAIYDYCHDGDPICGLVDERTIDGRSYPVRDFAHIVAVSSAGAENPSILTEHTNYLGADTANAAQQLKSLLGLQLASTDASTSAALTPPDAVTVDDPATFNAGGSLSDPADPIVSYSWTVDPGTSRAQSWTTPQALSKITFASTGDQQVKLTITTASGHTSTTAATVDVQAAPTSAPEQPTHVEAVSGSAAAALSWPEVPGAQFYAVTDGNGKLLTAFTPLVPGQNPVSWTDTGLKNGSERSYKVYAVNSMGASVASATIRVTPHAAVERPVAPPVSLPRPDTTLIDPELIWSLGLGLIVVVVAIALIRDPSRSRRRRYR